jgi:hypothetical protein
MSVETDIHIVGPGMTFYKVVDTLKQALEAAGAKVMVCDFEKRGAYTPPTLEGYEIVIRTHHQPWGG